MPAQSSETQSALSAWLSPVQLAEQLGVDPGKVIDWIHAGDLVAVNLATRAGGRPRWRISPQALDTFLLRRQSSAPPKIRKQSKPRRTKEFV